MTTQNILYYLVHAQFESRHWPHSGAYADSPIDANINFHRAPVLYCWGHIDNSVLTKTKVPRKILHWPP